MMECRYECSTAQESGTDALEPFHRPWVRKERGQPAAGVGIEQGIHPTHGNEHQAIDRNLRPVGQRPVNKLRDEGEEKYDPFCLRQ